MSIERIELFWHALMCYGSIKSLKGKFRDQGSPMVEVHEISDNVFDIALRQCYGLRPTRRENDDISMSDYFEAADYFQCRDIVQSYDICITPHANTTEYIYFCLHYGVNYHSLILPDRLSRDLIITLLTDYEIDGQDAVRLIRKMYSGRFHSTADILELWLAIDGKNSRRPSECFPDVTATLLTPDIVQQWLPGLAIGRLGQLLLKHKLIDQSELNKLGLYGKMAIVLPGMPIRIGVASGTPIYSDKLKLLYYFDAGTRLYTEPNGSETEFYVYY